jgi:replicative DNA helicase
MARVPSLKLDEIVSIEDMGEQETYDFNIPQNHCFFANDILVHNSDTVILLEWNWEKDEYLIRIEKQRHGMVGNLRVDFKPQYSKFTDSDRPIFERPRKDLK